MQSHTSSSCLYVLFRLLRSYPDEISRRKGIRFPEDLSITGFDDNLYAQLSCPSLTTIHQDIFPRGTIAAEYLFKMIDGWNPKTTNLSLPVRLVVRDSVKLLNPLEDDSSDDGSAL